MSRKVNKGGVVRLDGKDMEALRRSRFELDGYRCQHKMLPHLGICGVPVIWDRGYPNSGHLAHIRNKRMWGDTLENTTTKCGYHHIQVEHSYGPSGVKPVPKKERRAN